VLHKEDAPNNLTNQNKDQSKKSLLELLKTDQSLRDELFGHLNNQNNN
jgi:hypothetical protein